MNVINTPSNNPNIKSPPEGGFIGPPDIRSQIAEILDINQGDSDEQFIELVLMKFPNALTAFNVRENGEIVKHFGNKGYIKLLDKGNGEISIEMIDMPKDGIEGMLSIILYSIENQYSKISGKVQPQRNHSERKKKILTRFQNNFGFTTKDGTYGCLDLSPENKKVLVNKVKYYLENGKWFTS